MLGSSVFWVSAPSRPINILSNSVYRARHTRLASAQAIAIPRRRAVFKSCRAEGRVAPEPRRHHRYKELRREISQLKLKALSSVRK